MKRILSLAVVLGAMTLGFAGCSEKASTTTEKTVSTPQGETTKTTETTVEKSGENPPPAN
jgi:ABC-type glycerol-3-phosphate transport system substrate-binding protein